MTGKSEYHEPEVARVGDAEALTSGDKEPVSDNPADVSAGYRDASTGPSPHPKPKPGEEEGEPPA